jgi:hypothetical protein
MNKIDGLMADALAHALQSCFLSARVRKFPKDYSGAPARRKTSGTRARKLALYASITGFKRLKIAAFSRYTRIAE